MEKTPATMIKEFVNSQKFESTADVMAAMKEMFGERMLRVLSPQAGGHTTRRQRRMDNSSDRIFITFLTPPVGLKYME